LSRVGAPFWILNSLTDGILAGTEETFFGQEVPIDLVGTGGTIPADLGDFTKIKEMINQVKGAAKSLGTKPY
jgi:hypothetical protein